jgi:hypothetical protein
MISGGTAPGIRKQLMEISGKLHTPPTLTLVALDRSWMGSTAGLYAAEKRKISRHYQQLHPACSLVTIPTELSWLLVYTSFIKTKTSFFRLEYITNATTAY